MKRITIYHNRDCVRCRRIARVNRLLNWFGWVDISTADPRIGPMRPGEIAVEDARTGTIVQGVAAVGLQFAVDVRGYERFDRRAIRH